MKYLQLHLVHGRFTCTATEGRKKQRLFKPVVLEGETRGQVE